MTNTFTPHAYQAQAIQHVLDNPEALLLLDMGLGKTVITLTAIAELVHNRFEICRVLVIAPKRVAEDTWSREAAKWPHLKGLRFSKILGSKKEREAALVRPADVYLINRENVPWLVQECGKNWPFDMIVIDELSSFKSSSSQRFRALRKVRPKVRRIVGLTGTPAPNGLLDLWPQVFLMDRGKRLGETITGYKRRYFLPGRGDPSKHIVYEWLLKEGADEEIHDAIADIALSMKSEDYLQLPRRIDNELEVVLPPAQRKQYAELERELLLDIPGGEITAENAAGLTNKLLQLSQGAVYDEDGVAHELHTAKLDALDSVLEEAAGQPVLLFYSYKHDLERIRKRYKFAETLDTPDAIERWNAGKIPLLCCHPASAGHGLNLQDGGHIVCWFGLTWSLELYQQANARLHRQGQARPVMVQHILTADTLDGRVLDVLQSKAQGQDALLLALKAHLEGAGAT